MSENWYEDYFGKGTIETRAHLDQKGRLFIADVDGGIKIPKDHDCDEMGCGSVGPHIHSVYINARTHHKLKETIKQLQDENEKLKEALERILKLNTNWDAGTICNYIDLSQKIAEQALKGELESELEHERYIKENRK